MGFPVLETLGPGLGQGNIFKKNRLHFNKTKTSVASEGFTGGIKLCI